MNGRPAHVAAMKDAAGCTPAGRRRAGPQMLDGSDGPARIVFESGDGGRHVARLDRWLAIFGLRPPAWGASRVIWLLDTSTVHWAGALPPAELRAGLTGLQAREAPVLWFRAGGGAGGRRSFTAPGVLGAGGIVDAVPVRVRASRLHRKVRLELGIDTSLWGLSAPPEPPDSSEGRLTIAVSGVPRPLEPQALTPWQ